MAAAEPKPNIILILTDDQRAGTLGAMPNVRSLLMDHGMTFRNGFVTNPLCCPSRASILTGGYSHTTGVYANTGVNGGWQAFKGHESSTIAVWLQQAGYSTALIGKYLNGYTRTTTIPPGWSRWFAWEPDGHGFYYDYRINDGGVLRHYGTDPDDYSTRVVTRQAVSFIHGAQSPFFLYYAPFAPHVMPDVSEMPDPVDRTAFSHLSAYRPPNYNEADVSDKPEWVRTLPRLTARRRDGIDAERLNAYRSLRAVDRAVGRIVGAVRDRGELSDTMFVFMSDNGFGWGEHRWASKFDAYEESIRVPYIVRYDPLIHSPRTDGSLVLNIDLAPTWAALAGINAPGADGRSLLHLLDSSSDRWRSGFLTEHIPEGHHMRIPPYCALRTVRHQYVAYGTGEKELYTLSRDPFELHNEAGSKDLLPLRRRLWNRLHALCDPPPPGYAFPPKP